jgi:hypothetical protein
VLAFSNQHLDISIHFFKRLLYRQETYPSPLIREPALPFEVNHEKYSSQVNPKGHRIGKPNKKPIKEKVVTGKVLT